MNSLTAPRTLSDYYLIALGVLLTGYAIFGKWFAYIGVPPLYIGEVVFVMGIIALLKSRCAAASLATVPSLLLGILLGWVAFRTLSYLGEFGVDALRDSVIVGYGGFAFTTAALLLEKPGRLSLMISYLRIVGSVIILVAPILITLAALTNVHLYITLDVFAYHLAGAALLILLGFKRAGVGWLALLFIAIALLFTQSRSATIAIVTSLTSAAVLTGRWRTLGAIALIMASIIGLAYALDLSISGRFSDATRNISSRQLIDNVFSIFGGTTQGNQWGTRQWRIEWWRTIFDYTFNGPYFWTGKGFGINLAVDDGILIGTWDPSAPLLRSPHNAHLTILARLGVPGLALWLLTLGSWCALLLVNMVHARRCGDHVWADLFVLIFCYALAFIVGSTFTVTLEGPFGGIWFWSLFGVGVGATMIYRASSRGSPANKRLANLAAPSCMEPAVE